jgi:hypothetical protein
MAALSGRMPKAQNAHLAFGFHHAINDQVRLYDRKARPGSSLQMAATMRKYSKRLCFPDQFFSEARAAPGLLLAI